jgi:hypothetical protein
LTGSERRDLAFAIAVTEYDHPGAAALPAGDREIRRVFDALADGGFDVDPEPLIGRVTGGQIIGYLARLDRPARRVLLYWSGHGVSDDTTSWLFTSETDPADPGGSGAVEPAAVAAVLGGLRQTTQILVLLDCCGSGDVALDIATAITLAPPPELPEHQAPPAISLISATYGAAEARPMLFANAVANALTSGPPSMLWPAQKAQVSPQELAEATSAWLRSNLASRSQRARSVGVHSGTGFFANPAYDPNARDVLLEADQTIRRGTVLDEVRAWHRAAGNGLFLLTGSLGTGKSTAVDQVVTESPGDGAAWTKVTLTRLDLRAATADLARRLGLAGPHSPEEVVAAAPNPADLAFDALDEAVPESRLEIVRRLLLPLAARPGVHVLVAHRSTTAHAGHRDEVAELQGAATAGTDLDADPAAERGIRRLVTRILEATPLSPYRKEPELARQVSAVIAARSDGIFYLAAQVAHRVARDPTTYEPDDPELTAMLTEGIGGAIARDLENRAVDVNLLLDILTPLAWARGAGVPVDGGWTAMADALRTGAGTPLTADDIVRVFGEISEFVSGGPAYRVRHQAIADFLRSRSGRTDLEAHRLITKALKPEPGGWPAAPQYVLDHLAEHADRGGTVLELFGDPDFMLFSEPRRTLVAVTRAERSNRRSPTLDLYLRAAARLADIPVDMRVFLLQSLSREGLRAAAPHERKFSVTSPCRTRWTTAQRPSNHRLIRIGPEELDMFTAVRTASGTRLVTATGSPDPAGTPARIGIEVWDPALLEPPQVLGGRAGRHITAMAAAPHEGDDEILGIAYGWGQNLLEARLIGGDRVLWTRAEVEAYDLSCVWAGDCWAFAANDHSGRIRLFRAADGHPLGMISGEGGYPKTVLGFRSGPADVLAVVTDWELSFWNAAGLAPLGTIRQDQSWSAAAMVTHPGGPVIVGGRTDGHLELRAVTDGRSLAVGQDDLGYIADHMAGLGSSVAVSARDEVQLWATQPIQRVHRYRGHAAEVTGLGVVSDGTDHQYLASAARDGSLRVWTDTRTVSWDKWQSEPPVGHFSRVFPARVGGRAAVLVEDVLSWVLVGQDDGEFLQRFDKKRARSRGESVRSDVDRFEVWAVARLGGESVAVAGEHGGSQEMWGVHDRADYALPTPGAPGGNEFRALLHTPAGPLLATGGGAKHPIGVFRITGGLQCWLPCPVGSRPRIAASCGDTDLVVVQAPDGSLNLHDPLGGGLRAQIRAAGDPLAATADQGRAAALVAVPGAGVHWADSTGATRLLAPGTHRQRAAVVSVRGRRLFALPDRDRVLLVRPESGEVAAAIPFLGQVNDVMSPAPGLLCLIVAARVVMVEVDL